MDTSPAPNTVAAIGNPIQVLKANTNTPQISPATITIGPDARESLLDRLEQAIEPLDVAGLNRAERRNWFPVEAEDLFRGAGKLRATREEVREMLERSGFLASSGKDRARQDGPGRDLPDDPIASAPRGRGLIYSGPSKRLRP